MTAHLRRSPTVSAVTAGLVSSFCSLTPCPAWLTHPLPALSILGAYRSGFREKRQSKLVEQRKVPPFRQIQAELLRTNQQVCLPFVFDAPCRNVSLSKHSSPYHLWKVLPHLPQGLALGWLQAVTQPWWETDVQGPAGSQDNQLEDLVLL